MELVQIVGIVFAAAVILIIAYLYRESKQISGKATVEIGPVKVELEGEAEKAGELETPAVPPVPKIDQSATDLGHIARSGPEIEGGAGDIKQTASGGGTIEDSAPKIS